MSWGRILAITASVVVPVIMGFLIARFWKDIRDQVATWLREQGLENSMLMDAWIELDNLIAAVRSRIFVKVKPLGETKIISETTYHLDEIDDSDVVAELEARGHIIKDIMKYIE